MRVTVIGCAGSFPGPDSPASSYLVQAEGFNLLLDIGNGAIGSLQRFHPLYDIDAICISHLHADHCLDLCGYWVARTYRPGGPAPVIPVYGPDDTARRMAKAYDLPEEPGMTGTFDFRPLERGPMTVGPFQITTALMPHPIEAFAFRIEHGGKVLAYSGDTGVSDALVEHARDADLFLCEASFLEGDNPPALHLTAREAADHAARARARRLVLTHLVPWNDADASLAEAKGGTYDGPIELAHVGAVYEL
ncbi:MBL fold metallo-hydrolase [Actinomadura flavalba]|uniref:MBL fold metallo-hydrolase n=1 Tax=Actinomadura flavalba TaxID=1120938 RepID=UPI0003A980D1|nr:MBL fold metallo-hydrolase [Actinomadura flavalba]